MAESRWQKTEDIRRRTEDRSQRQMNVELGMRNAEKGLESNDGLILIFSSFRIPISEFLRARRLTSGILFDYVLFLSPGKGPDRPF